jgi:CheY-like chemotaxis protein
MSKKRALILEDDAITASLEKLVLQREGFEVEVAKDGAEGLKRLKQNGYDLIISDVMMPKMRGDEFYIRVKELYQGLEKRIIFVSGSINDFVMSTGNRFLPKPFSSQLLAKVVRDVSRNREAFSS